MDHDPYSTLENDELRTRLDSLRSPVFACLDGAQFDDLPRALVDADLLSKSLYIDRGRQGPNFDLTAPRLVRLDRLAGKQATTEGIDHAALDQVLEVSRGRHATVFWASDAGFDQVWRHLRGLNQVRLHRSAGMEPVESWEVDPLVVQDPIIRDEGEIVLFRHADANVMAQVLPSLDIYGFARLFGPANTIVFRPDPDWADNGGSVLYAPRPHDLPSPRTGLLELDHETLARIEQNRLHALRRGRVRYLKETCPEATTGVPQSLIVDHIRIAEETANAMGLRSEASHRRWAFMMCRTRGKILQSSKVKSYLADGPEKPDVRLRMLMHGLMDAMKTDHHR